MKWVYLFLRRLFLYFILHSSKLLLNIPFILLILCHNSRHNVHRLQLLE
jgi:hypothetical protein